MDQGRKNQILTIFSQCSMNPGNRKMLENFGLARIKHNHLNSKEKYILKNGFFSLITSIQSVEYKFKAENGT